MTSFQHVGEADSRSGSYPVTSIRITTTAGRYPRRPRSADVTLTTCSRLTPPVFHILVACSIANGTATASCVAGGIERLTAVLTLGPGRCAAVLKRMLTAGLVEESDERRIQELDDERRR